MPGCTACEKNLQPREETWLPYGPGARGPNSREGNPNRTLCPGPGPSEDYHKTLPRPRASWHSGGQGELSEQLARLYIA
eukprot:6705735-Pyramimonas_sp.AAC.1